MTISAFDLFKIGVGPSSSHTVGPMRAACLFARRLDREGTLAATAAVRVELFGSLGATGHGHGTVKAVVAGLSGEMPDTVDPEHAQRLLTTTDSQIAHIAFSSGFGSINRFNSAFRKLCDCTPRQYRERYRQMT